MTVSSPHFSVSGNKELQHGKCLVLSSFHLFTLTGSFVVKAAEVQDAVDDHTVELLVVGASEFVGIGEDGVY